MGKVNKDKDDRSASRNDIEDEDKESGKASMFERLFAPHSVGTSVSSESDDDDHSLGSQSNQSTISGSSEESGESSVSSVDSIQRFDRELRAKHRAACKNMTSGKYSKAIKTFEGILADLLDRFGEENHRVGAALHNVAVANLRAGQLSDACDAIEEAIRIRQLTLGEKHSKVADSMVEHGIILLSMKNYDESLKVFKQALRLREKEAKLARTSEATREAKLKIAKIRHNIGCVNFEVGNLDAADEAYTEAIEAQRSAFGTWTTPFMLMTDTTKPGFLTMASTMCNKGYIALEQARFTDAIKIFFDSLKIQKNLLEANNKLILSTLENIGFCYLMLHELEKASQIYKELVELQQESYGEQAQRGWATSLRKLIYCQIRLYEFEPAFDNLRLLEDYLSTRAQKTKTTEGDLEKTHELMKAVNYQIFKFPTIAEYTTRAVGACGICADDRDGIDVDPWFPKKPANGSKMSGHRMTYA